MSRKANLGVVEALAESLTMRLVAQGMEEDKRPGAAAGCNLDVVVSHDQTMDNYIWLAPYYGRVLKIDFREPAGTGPWRTYDRYWWQRHASAVDHTPSRLYKEHVRAFVDPKTKVIDLVFTFQLPDGTVYSTPPNQHFYELEAEYFARFGLCEGNKVRGIEPHRRSEPPVAEAELYRPRGPEGGASVVRKSHRRRSSVPALSKQLGIWD